MLETLEFWYTHRGAKSQVPHKVFSLEDHQDGMDDLPLDYRGFLAEMDGNNLAVREIILGFMDILIKQMDLIHKGIERNDLLLVHREAHSIKGGALNLGADSLVSWAQALEQAASEQYTEIIPHLYQNLQASVSEILACRDRISLIG